MKIKTIDINALEWFDKINGNSYFAGTVTINYGAKNERTFLMPYQYGYGRSYEQEAWKIIKDNFAKEYDGHLWQFCKDCKVILRSDIKRGCLKKELKAVSNV